MLPDFKKVMHLKTWHLMVIVAAGTLLTGLHVLYQSILEEVPPSTLVVPAAVTIFALALVIAIEVVKRLQLNNLKHIDPEQQGVLQRAVQGNTRTVNASSTDPG